MGIRTLSIQELIRHIGIWICLSLFIFIFFNVDGPLYTKCIYTFLFIFNLVIPYYILLLHAIPNLIQKKWFLFVTAFFSAIAIFIAIDILHIKFILPHFNVQRLRENFTLVEFFKIVILRFLLLCFVSAGVCFNRIAILRVRDLNEKKKNLISQELTFLANQFHSHLTFNFINFCRGQLLKISSIAAESFENFTGMLNYSLNAKPGKFIALDEELDYIHYFLEVQRCITSNVFVDFKKEGNMSSLQILQGVLSVFVDNAFKHGVYYDEQNPIKIYISTQNGNTVFYIENKKGNHKSLIPSGIGLINTRQALDIFYKDLYLLDINDTETSYTIKLNLKLN